MDVFYPVALVTLMMGLMLFGMAIAVARVHAKTAIHAPQMTGDPLLERAVRAHANTLEWIPVVLPAMWVFAIYWNAQWAAALGGVWILARIAYFVGYLRAPTQRYPGFLAQVAASAALLFGALGRLIYLWLA